MTTILKKVCNRALHLYAAGSPLRYSRKAALYLMRLSDVADRKRRSQNLLNDSRLQRPLEEVNQAGYSIVSELIDPQLLDDLKKASADKLESGSSAKAIANRPYFGQLLGAEENKPGTPFVRFALQEKILRVVSTRFGEVPRLSGVAILVSKPSNSTHWIEAQQWHKDLNDTKILKLFVYLSDVLKEEDGPFTFIPAPYSAKVKNRIIPGRISDEEMARQGCADRAVSVYGKAGTAFLIDTGRCYHFGSRCTASTRVAFIASFNTITPMEPDVAKFAPNGTNLSELESLVLDL